MSNVLPDVSIDEEAKKLVAWLMYETKKDASTVIKILGRHYHQQVKAGRTLFNLHEILKLRASCEGAEIDPAEIRAGLEYKAKLESLGLISEDLPRLSDVAESLAQAGISHEQCAKDIELRYSLEKVKIDFTNLDQLQADIGTIHKLTEMPEERVRELASWLTETHKLKENLDSLHIKEEQAKGRLDSIKRQISMLEKTQIARKQECSNVIAQIEQHEKDLTELTERRDSLEAEAQTYDVALQLVIQFNQFLLSNKVDSDDRLWTALKNAFVLKKTQDYSDQPVPPKFSEAVRIEIVRLLRKIVDEDIVTYRDKDSWRKMDKIKAAEELCAAPSEALSKAEKGMKKIDEGLDEVRDAKYEIERSLEKIKYPYSNA